MIGALIRDEAEIGVCVFYRTPGRSAHVFLWDLYYLLSVTVLMSTHVSNWPFSAFHHSGAKLLVSLLASTMASPGK